LRRRLASEDLAGSGAPTPGLAGDRSHCEGLTAMKFGKSCAALVLGLIGSISAEAADFNRGSGGTKDYRYGTPVPAPIPVQETFRYYLRADLGLGIQDVRSQSERGLTYGTLDSIAPFATNSAWFNDDYNTFVVGGLGAGIYLTPRLRSDITIDWRNASEVEASGSYAYTQFTLLPAPPVATGNTVSGSVREHTTLRDTLGLVNLYWDLWDRGRFTPYLGIAGGFALRDVDRRYTNTETIVDGVGTLVATRSVIGASKAAEVVPAAALMAGAAYALSPGVLVDLNYRFSYLGSVETTTSIGGTQSRLTIGETYEHALRAGLRWNVW
jgi:opacity protein-like surface antigen